MSTALVVAELAAHAELAAFREKRQAVGRVLSGAVKNMDVFRRGPTKAAEAALAERRNRHAELSQRLQTVAIRARAEQIRSGEASAGNLSLPVRKAPELEILVPATTIVALHGIQYRGPQAEPILIPLGGATVPLIVAQRATELGLEFSADNREGKAALTQHQQGLSLSKIYADRIGHQTSGAFRDVGVDVGLWIEAERARLAQRAA